MNAAALKLNLGSRDRAMPGFKNMDCEAHPGVDFVGDVADLSRFESESVAEIFASNIIEHFPHGQTVKVLKEWRRVLEKGGILYLSVPDFARAVEIYRMRGLEDWVENFTHGDQGYATAFHYAIFDYDRLNRKCVEAGFSYASRVNSFDFAAPNDCSNLVSNADGKRVSLNVAVVK